MNKDKLFPYVRLLWAPVALIVLGAVLLFNPDSASALISKVLGGLLTLIGIAFGIGAIAEEKGRMRSVITCLVLVVAGGWLTRNPLALAAWFGRIVGVLLLINGFQDMHNLRSMGRRFALPGLVTLVGVVLILLPMTTTRLVFALCGIVVLVLGIIMLLDRLHSKRLNGGDSNIVDAL